LNISLWHWENLRRMRSSCYHPHLSQLFLDLQAIHCMIFYFCLSSPDSFLSQT
jgi:hypothetical protein